MSNINCEACEELRETSPAYVTNGVTSSICASLQNDTGLTPSKNHNDYEDMTDINDCTIGRMASELQMYDVCDWKEFMGKFIPNLYEFNKAGNCVDAGQWKNIHNNASEIDELWKFVQQLCEKINMSVVSAIPAYGVLPYLDDQSKNIGTIVEKNGSPLIQIAPAEEIQHETSWKSAGIGIGYKKQQYQNCTNTACQLYNYMNVWIHDSRISGDVEIGDILWYCDKETFQSVSGFTDEMWERFTISSWTWHQGTITDMRIPALHVDINPSRMGEDYITIEWLGTSYPNNGINATQWIEKVTFDDNRIYVDGCN